MLASLHASSIKALAKRTRKLTYVFNLRSTCVSFGCLLGWTCVDFGRVHRKSFVYACDLRELASRLANPFGHPSQFRTKFRFCKLASTCESGFEGCTFSFLIILPLVYIYPQKSLSQRQTKMTDANFGLNSPQLGLNDNFLMF